MYVCVCSNVRMCNVVDKYGRSNSKGLKYLRILLKILRMKKLEFVAKAQFLSLKNYEKSSRQGRF